MSATEGIVLLDSPIDIVLDEPRAEKKTKDSMGGEARKRLAEISNLPQQPHSTKNENEKCMLNATNVNQLQKERMMLIQLLSDRNKIIELSGIELQKLRTDLQKMQQQNLQLAQANSQMLMELNASKDRLKQLHHELGCKNGLLKARKLEERPKVRRCQRIDDQTGTIKSKDTRESSEAVSHENELCQSGRKVKQSKSLGPSIGRQAPLRDGTDNKRLSLRRQSARFKPEEAKPTEDDSFEIDDVKISARSSRDDQVQEDGLTSSMQHSSARKRDKEGGIISSSDKTQYLKRSSIGRPVREAAQKIQSYKEMPLKAKLRRTE